MTAIRTDGWYAGKKVTVLGLGTFGGGVAAARFLAGVGARVTVTDAKPAQKLEASVRALDGLGIRFVLGEHRREDLAEADLVVHSPAVPPSSEWLAVAREAGVPLTTEVVLALERLEGPFALVTGSKGKSTSATLAGAMLAGDGPVVVAGNNERPLLNEVLALPPGARVVVEVSSFMADAIANAAGERAAAGDPPFARPRVVALTSLTPEHLTWHGGVEPYYEAKLSLLDLGPQTVVFPARDAQLGERVPGRAGDAELIRTQVNDNDASVAGLRLLGRHNRENAQVAAAVARCLGASAASIRAGAASFEPLPHRLETVAVSAGGVRFVNDSTATTPEAAVAALQAVPQPAVLMAGGADKGVSYEAFGQAAARSAHTVVCLGVIGERIAAAAEGAADRQAEVVRAGSFEDAFAAAVKHCPPGGTVLLAPGASSYDMFNNFKARGERFRQLAHEACQQA